MSIVGQEGRHTILPRLHPRAVIVTALVDTAPDIMRAYCALAQNRASLAP
jgi:hypothetical protein